MDIEKTYAKVKALHSNKNKEEIYADVKTSKQNKTKVLEKKQLKYMMKWKQASKLKQTTVEKLRAALTRDLMPRIKCLGNGPQWILAYLIPLGGRDMKRIK
jgi:hypothetical protein